MSPVNLQARGGTSARAGFSLLELLVVMMIATVLMGFMFSSFRDSSAQRSALSARDTYLWMSRRARSLAMQRGIQIQLRLAPGPGRVVLARTNPDTVYEARYFNTDFGATVTSASGDSVMICFRSRGFNSPCGPTALPTTLTFTVRGKTAGAVVQQLGQVEAQ